MDEAKQATATAAAEEDTLDRALGCVLGAVAGDACGTFVERLGRAPTQSECTRAWTFPGGGFYRVAPGQCTDDGEMTVALFQALLSANFAPVALAAPDPLRALANHIARWQADWALSQPFDMGITIGSTIGIVLNAGPAYAKHFETVGLAVAMQTAANSAETRTSQSNGALMRITPVAVWGRHLSDQEMALLCALDTGLSHAHPFPLQCSVCYCLAAAHLLRFAGDRLGAFRRARAYAQEHCSEEVLSWLDTAQGTDFVPFFPQAGWVKIGFVYAFRCLLHARSPEQAIVATILGGGDTDTNAAIVGGLSGALHGWRAFPAHARDAVLGSNSEAGRPRPAWLHPKRVHESMATLLAHSPRSLFAVQHDSFGPDLLRLSPGERVALCQRVAAPFAREDEQPDTEFYAQPRFVHHISSGARSSLALFLRAHLAPKSHVLDLCSSWTSHVPHDMGLRVVGVGLNAAELAANPALSAHHVHDLNRRDPAELTALLLKEQGPFDAVLCTVSVDYLTQPVAVLRALRPVLRAGAAVYLVLSDRCFPSKVTAIWRSASETERLEVVASWLEQAGLVAGLRVRRITLPPFDDGNSNLWVVEAKFPE